MRRWTDKDPIADTTYTLDLGAAIRAVDAADALASVTWTATPAGLTLTDEGLSGDVAAVGIAGGADRTRYLVACTYATANGRTDRWTEPLFVVVT